MNFNSLSQAELAKIVGKDRTTIRAWTLAGMPYEKPDKKGSNASFDSGHCLNWLGGHLLAEKRSLTLSPWQKVVVGWVIGIGIERTKMRKDDDQVYLEMMGRAGIRKEEAIRLIEFARGVLASVS